MMSGYVWLLFAQERRLKAFSLMELTAHWGQARSFTIVWDPSMTAGNKLQGARRENSKARRPSVLVKDGRHPLALIMEGRLGNWGALERGEFFRWKEPH